MQLLRKAAQKQAGELGINVVDVRIKGIELPASTSNEIYQRMRADMQEIANRHRADGQAAAEQIQAKADADVMVLLAKTRSAAQKSGQLDRRKLHQFMLKHIVKIRNFCFIS